MKGSLRDAKILIIGNHKFFSDISSLLSPLGIEITHASTGLAIRKLNRDKKLSAIIYDDDTYRSKNKMSHFKTLKILQKSAKDVIFMSSRRSISAVSSAKILGARDYIVKPYNQRELIARVVAVLQNKIRITCIGGGTGLFHILLGLKKIPNILLTSVVSTSDDGGSSGRLKTSFGILPPGDVRRSLVALSNAPEVMNQVMRYRFDKGDGIKGHSFGNLFLAVLSRIKGSLSEAVRSISDILNVQGIVLPVTNVQTTLCARFANTKVVKGESNIDLCEDRNPDLQIQTIWHEPATFCTIDAFSSIINSEMIIIGPGDLFTSIATNLVVKDIRKALAKTEAKKVYICNLMTKPGETANYTAFDHTNEIIKYLGGDYIAYVIVSNTKLSKKAIREYAKKEQSPVRLGDIEAFRRITKAKIILADVGHETELVRHDSEKVRNEIAELLKRCRKGRRPQP